MSRSVTQRGRDTLLLQLLHDVMSRDHNILTLIDPRSETLDPRERESENMGRRLSCDGGGGGQTAGAWDTRGSGAMQTLEL